MLKAVKEKHNKSIPSSSELKKNERSPGGYIGNCLGYQYYLADKVATTLMMPENLESYSLNGSKEQCPSFFPYNQPSEEELVSQKEEEKRKPFTKKTKHQLFAL